MERLFMVAKGFNKAKTPAQEIYRKLVFNRFEDFIRTSFPLFTYFAEDELSSLIEEFLKLRHPHPLLIDLGREFLQFFREKDTPLKKRIPFLEDLLLYEWTEIEIFNAPDEETEREFSWEGKYIFSRSSRLLHLTYPVHRAEELSEDEIIEGAGNYHFILYRDREHEVRRAKLTPFVYGFLRAVGSGKVPADVIDNSGLGKEDKEESKPYLERFLKDLVNLGVLIGANA